MQKNKRLLHILIIGILSVALSGCVSLKSNKAQDTTAIDGGLFKSTDKGKTWQHKVLIPTISGKPGNFAGVNVAALVMDPNDRNALYFGSIGNGLLYTYDGAKNWHHVSGLGSPTIRSVAVDPNDKCTIYATIGNRAFKSDDCNRSWDQIYFDNQSNITINAVAIDPFNSDHIYIGASRGDLIKSFDGGESWQTIHRINNSINRILIDPSDSRNLYLITAKKGILRSLDNGFSWSGFNAGLKENNFGTGIKDFLFIKDLPGTMYIATKAGIIKTIDNGETWEKINLIPPQQQATVNAIAVNPQNLDEIYYVTHRTFYSSVDGGVNWTPARLPTSRAGWRLIIDPEKPNIIYMAVRAYK